MAKQKSEGGLDVGALIPAVPGITAYDKYAVLSDGTVDESALFERVAAIIESRKSRAAAYANSEVTLMFWEVGQTQFERSRTAPSDFAQSV